jgi:hypothetical protein
VDFIIYCANMQGAQKAKEQKKYMTFCDVCVCVYVILCMCVYIYIYNICMHIYIYIIYIHTCICPVCRCVL